MARSDTAADDEAVLEATRAEVEVGTYAGSFRGAPSEIEARIQLLVGEGGTDGLPNGFPLPEDGDQLGYATLSDGSAAQLNLTWEVEGSVDDAVDFYIDRLSAAGFNQHADRDGSSAASGSPTIAFESGDAAGFVTVKKGEEGETVVIVSVRS